jgi:D-alanyl-D-alanine carboxypeptidase
LSCAAIAAVLTISSDTAVAWHHRHFARHSARYGAYAPPTATIVVDGNTGAVLEQSNPDAPRHPASLTKVMTLYLLFEQLDAGKINLNTRLYVTEHAAEQAPTKLDLRPGQTIAVEDAIKAIVTRSANDAAVVIAENLGGSEKAFAKMMTEKAAELGMTHTTYVNASGLPDDDQVTTARDQALLGRAIQDRFPRYYPFFSTTSFVFRGQVIRGHDHLLGTVAGVDGIKTGYTNGSGFNLLTSVHRDGRYLVAVVIGGRSAAERDAHMRALIAANIELAAVRQAVPRLAVRPASRGGQRRLARARTFAPMSADSIATASPSRRTAVGSNAPIRPVVVKTITYRTVTAPARPIAPMPVLVPAQSASTVAAEPAAEPQGPTPRVEESSPVMASAEPNPAAEPPPSRAELVRVVPATDAGAAAPVNTADAEPVFAAAPHAHSGWMIQIGAFDGEQAAREHLDEAKLKLPSLASADPFTEPVQKGDTTLYRARFSGLDKETAEAACRALRRSDVSCMALKD